MKVQGGAKPRAKSYPRNQPFRTARLPKGAGLFFVCFYLLREDKQGGEITDQFYLQFAVDGMEANLIAKAPGVPGGTKAVPKLGR